MVVGIGGGGGGGGAPAPDGVSTGFTSPAKIQNIIKIIQTQKIKIIQTFVFDTIQSL
jgi:hypothetical protein